MIAVFTVRFPAPVARVLAAAALACCVLEANAAGIEDAINAIAKPSVNKKSYFAVVDVKTDRAGEVVDAALNAVKRYASGASVNQKIPPAVKPAVPNRMRLVSRGPGQEPQCDGDIANIAALDTSMSKYGEGTFSVVCIFPYKGGYQINYFASFSQQTGGANANILGAMIGRLVTNAIGIGDSSSFVGKTIESIQEKLADAGLKGTLVELFPEIKGLAVVKDAAPMADATPPVPATAPSPSAIPVQAQAPVVADGTPPLPAEAQMLSPLMAQVAAADPAAYQEAMRAMADATARMREAQAAAIAQYASAQGVPAPGAVPAVAATVPRPQPAVYSVPGPVAGEGGALQARKDLTAMGLTYHDGHQFMAAIKRGDALAVRLFIVAQGVDPAQAGPDGVTPLQAARQVGQPDVIAMLQQAGAR